MSAAIAKSSGALHAERALLSAILSSLATEFLQYQSDVLRADTAPEIASVVRKTMATLAEASAGWNGLSQTIRDGWRI